MGPTWFALDTGVRISVPGARGDGDRVWVDVRVFNDRPTVFRVASMTVDTPRPGGGSLTCPLAVIGQDGRPSVAVDVPARTSVDLLFRCPVEPAAALTVTGRVYGEAGVTFTGPVSSSGPVGARPGDPLSAPTSSSP